MLALHHRRHLPLQTEDACTWVIKPARHPTH
jgi:hypothetical protein